MAAIVETEGHDGNGAALEEANDLLDSTEYILRRVRENVRTWWTGALRDHVWRQIHMAEALIVSMLPDAERQQRTAEILFDARLILDRDDPVMKADLANPQPVGSSKPGPVPALQGYLFHIMDDRAGTGLEFKGRTAVPVARRSWKEPGETPEETSKRVFAHEIVRRYREAWDDRYTASRGFRNRLIVLIIIVALAVAVLIAGGSLGMVWLDVSAKPTHAILAPHLNDFLAMLTIALLGGIGGLISGAGEVLKVGGVYNPFSLPWYQLFFKIPMGALTGILGVLAIKGNLLPDMHLTMNNWSQIIIWALVFGASQQLITFMVDRRVRALSTGTPQEQVVNK